MKASWMIAGLVASVAAGLASAHAEEAQKSFTATLAAAPNVTTSGTGAGEFTYDPATHVLTYNVTHSGLSGPALMAHIHGPADAGANAGVAVPFPSAASPISGKVTLTEEQATQLLAGKYYVNVHTAANKGGEVRGQIVAKSK